MSRYDIQEEKGRTEEERPFPFCRTWEPRYYAKLVRKFLDTEPIVYCAISDRPKEGLGIMLNNFANSI